MQGRRLQKGNKMPKYKASISRRVRGMVEWQLEHYREYKDEIQQYWADMIPSATPKYTDGKGGGEVSRNAENTALRIATSPYLMQIERSCKAIEYVLKNTDDIDRKLVELVYWKQAYTVAGAAQLLHMNTVTAYRHINNILLKIALELGYVPP